MVTIAEYIWIDGTQPTASLRSKTNVLVDVEVEELENGELSLEAFPSWGADGSSTNQADGHDSDIGLVPVRAVYDPFREGQYLVLCEVMDSKGNPHQTNTRAPLRALLETQGGHNLESLFGFEQEYTILRNSGRPLGFPESSEPGPQGPYYCAVGTGNIFGRNLYEDILMACIEAGLTVSGANFEVMPGQAEIQIGAADPLTTSDHLWLCRWIMGRLSEEHDLIISFAAKPATGDWNGAGMHTNFSTKGTRAPGGMKDIEDICAAFGQHIEAHLSEYGHGYELRLTGAHETCSYKEFRWGVSDRTASIRIPRHVAQDGAGYLEDRRPNANADPYRICARMLGTVLGM